MIISLHVCDYTHIYIYILHNFPHSINPWANHHLGRLQAALAFFSGRKETGSAGG